MSTNPFSETLFELLDDVRYRRVPDGRVEDEVYALRYRAYREENFVAVNPDERVIDKFDDAPNGATFGVYVRDELAGAVRLHHVSPEQRISPSMVVFPEFLNQQLDEGKSYIDPSRFVSDMDWRLRLPALPFLTLRIVAMACEYYNVDFCVSSVRKEHAAFYRRVFGSTAVDIPPGTFPGLEFYVHLYVAELSVIRDRVARRFPFFMSTAAERADLFGSCGETGVGHLVAPTARAAQDDEHEKPRS